MCYHSLGGIIPLYADIMATVISSYQLFPIQILSHFNSGSCYHSLGGIIPFLANIIATVQPYFSVIVGSWWNSNGGIIPFYVKYIANVILSQLSLWAGFYLIIF